jgi:ribonuclease P/MRP protein subunit RPP40
MVLLDFAKAFDKVDHKFLLKKLEAYGFGKKISNWVCSFLTNRKQRVILGESKSEWRDVLSGVPQGSVLGPLLFLVFINDMPDLVNHFCKLFADDTKLIAVIRDPTDKDILQQDIDALVCWSQTWKMSFNERKCKVMHFEKKYTDHLNEAFNTTTSDPNWDVDPNQRHQLFTMKDQNGIAHVLGETSSERDLGIIIDNKLKWKRQYDLMRARAYSVIGSLKRSFTHWTPQTFRILYTTFVRPHLEYCASV